METEDQDIIDIDEAMEETAKVIYDISSYGIDYDVDGLVKRLNKGDIYIPPFQRDYVWNQAEASRLIESLLLGLPVPGVFLAKDNASNKLSVIDGQQRLKTLQYFYNGYFNPKDGESRRRVFNLIKVQSTYEGRTYEQLEEEDRIKLADSIIHATIIKQESPDDNNTSIYHVFERLNTGGRKLAPQEIRSAIYIGELNQLIHSLNDNIDWRELYGKKSIRLRDEELILRFLAIYTNLDNYTKPMKEFLNRFNSRNKNPTDSEINNMRTLFGRTTKIINDNFGPSAFRPDRVFNAAAFETLMVGIAHKVAPNIAVKYDELAKNIHLLFDSEEFKELITRSTSDEKVVKTRHELFSNFIDKYVQ